MIDLRQIIRALCGHRRASVGNSFALEVSMNSEMKKCTKEHMYTLLLKFWYQICACVREQCAVLGDKWVALDTAIVSRTILISPSTAYRSRTQAHVWHLNFKISSIVCAQVHPDQYWVHGRATAVASLLMCHAWLLLAYSPGINDPMVLLTSSCIFSRFFTLCLCYWLS